MQSHKPVLLVLIGMIALGVLTNGCALFSKKGTTTIGLHEEADSGLPKSRVMPVDLPTAGLKLTVSPFASLTDRDIQRAEIVQTAGGAAILLRFDVHGMMALDEMTTRCRGKHIVVFLNERPVAAWLVDKRLTNGQFLLEGEFTDAEAQKAAEALNRQAAKR